MFVLTCRKLDVFAWFSRARSVYWYEQRAITVQNLTLSAVFNA